VVKVDTDGLKDRTVELPIQTASYRHLTPVGSSLFYLRQGSKDTKPVLLTYDLAQKKETSLGTINGYEISADHKKMIVSRDSSYSIIDLPKAPLGNTEPLLLAGMDMKLDRHQEWAQIFRESWRQMRDFFYDPNMHGVDWQAVRQKYEPLVAHVNHRAD